MRSTVLERQRQLSDFAGDILRDALDGDLRLERLRISEDAAELVEGGRFGELGERNRMHLLGGAGEVGVDFNPGDIADDQQRRVIERFAVLQQLTVGIGEILVLALALVLPRELVLPPDVGEAVIAPGTGRRAARDIDALFERVFGPLGVVLGRGGLGEHAAEADEMFLARGTLGEFDVGPDLHELLRCHRFPALAKCPFARSPSPPVGAWR
ncbi:hypothetical protein IPV69_00005 [Humisphaera borealis]|uniref:Uncharacterized protein n=1 Tax=Humisphaera borealis TaxID=2807512 RepID=A0A7M2WWT8_9BACT|nr:hypothetical protein [Humisphaera borealis]QOV89794.1 hypothetical protein IPV69_00005 [Humisphaera borealis]